MWAKVAMVLSFGLAAMATGYEYEYEYEGSSTTAKKFELPDALFVPYTAYTYNYTVEALSSVPDEMKTLTGMRISCTLDVTIEPAEESRSALLRLRNCDVSVVNEDQAKHGNTPFVMLSAERFTRVDSIAAVGARMQTHLHKPIAFQYQRGSVGETKTREDDPPWSVNIKKGVLSLLQTSTKEARDQRLFETDAMGVCESAYVYSTQPPYNGRLRDSATVLRVLNITKSRIYSNCSKEPLVYTTFPFSEGVGVMNSTAHVDYNVAIVDDGKPVVERVYARSQHIFAPFGYDHGYLSASTHQLLELASFASFTQSSPLPAGLTKTTSVEMEQPQESFGENLPSAKNKVHSLLADLREAHAAGKREHAGCTLISLVDELKKLDLAGFKAVLQLNEREEGTPSEPEERQRQRRFLIDLLPTVGSRHAVRMMKELLKSDKTAERVLSLVPLLNFLMPPHPTVLPEVAKLCETSEMKVSKGRCEKVAKLAFGSLVYNLFSDRLSAQTTRVRTTRCAAVASHAECGVAFSATAAVLKRWLTAGLQSKKENETIAALEAIANSGHPGVFEEVKTILEDTSVQLSVKVTAGYALRKMMTTGKKEAVFRVLLPMLRDALLDVELRVMAYTVLMQSGLSEELLETLAHVLNDDRSTHLVNYIHNHLKSVCNSDLPPHQHATKLRTLLAAVRKPAAQYSPFDWQSHVPFYSEETKFGGSFSLASFSTPKSFLPRAIDVKLSAYLFGRRVNLVEMISRVEGLQPVLDKMAGPGAAWTSLFGEKKRGDAEEEAESQSSTKKPSTPKQEPFVAHLMLKLFGKHVSFAFVNAHSVMRALFGKQDGLGREVEGPVDLLGFEQLLSNGLDRNLHRDVLLFTRVFTPTLAGIPLYLNATFGLDLHADKFKVTAGVEPALFSTESDSESESEREREPLKKLSNFLTNLKSETLKRKLTLNVQGNGKVAAIAHAVLGFDLHEVATLSGFHAHVLSDFSKETLTTELHADVKNGLLSWTIDVPKTRHVALNASAAPFGFVTIPVGSIAWSGSHVVHANYPQKHAFLQTQTPIFHYYRRNEELNVTATVTKRAFELVLHPASTSSVEKLRLTTTIGANVTFSSNGVTMRYPPPQSRSLLERNSESESERAADLLGPAESTGHWSLSVSSALQTTSSRSGDRPLLSIQSGLTVSKVLHQKHFDVSFKVEHDLGSQCVDSDCRTGASRSDASPWSAVLSANGKYFSPSVDKLPHYSLKKQPSAYSIDNQLGANFTVCFGKSECSNADESAKRLNVVIGLKKSEKQKQLERLWWTYVNKPLEHKNMTMTMRRCKQELIKGYSHAEACYKLWLSFLHFNKLDVQLDWSKLSTDLTVRKMLHAYGSKAMTYIRKWLSDKWSPHYDEQYSSPHSVSSDVTRLIAERDPETYTVDVEVRHEHSRWSHTPGYIDKFEKLSPSWRVCAPSAYLPYWQSCLLETIERDPTVCYVRHDFVSTFDGNFFHEPTISESGREFIVAKDASEKTRFELTVKNVDVSHKRVNLTLTDYTVSVEPEFTQDGRHSDVKVSVWSRVTGESRELVVSQGDYLTIVDRQGQPIVYFTRLRSSHVTVYAIRDGVTLHCDGYSVQIQVSPFYYNLLRGICGSYNAEKWDDFAGTAGEIYAEPSRFVAAYSIDPMQRTAQYNTADRRNCREHVSVQEKNENALELLCIGKAPITTCESSCSAIKKLTHVCVDKASETYRALLREYAHDSLLDVELPKLPEIIRKLHAIDSAAITFKRFNVNSC